jgi:hypothetical protein
MGDTARNKIIEALSRFPYTAFRLKEVGYASLTTSHEVAGDIADAILNALGDMPFHVARFYRNGDDHEWTIQHRLDCRPDLLACPFSRARPDRYPEPGEYHVELNPVDYEEMRIIDG